MTVPNTPRPAAAAGGIAPGVVPGVARPAVPGVARPAVPGAVPRTAPPPGAGVAPGVVPGGRPPSAAGAAGVAAKPAPGAVAPAPAQVDSHDSLEKLRIEPILEGLLEANASDLHLTVDAHPTIRRHGEMKAMNQFPVLNNSTIQRILYTMMTQKQRERFEEHLELDFAYTLPGRARFRVNVFRQKGNFGTAMRVIPSEIKRLETLGVPPVVSNFASLPRGLVLVTGPTGSGKSTTLASLIDMANRQRKDHIMTVEDPIEFIHQHQGCIVNQREVGEDTYSFAAALKHVLRQDPDIILVGELRDLETIGIALTAAETGHCVFATLHTSSAAETVTRVIDVFPPGQQDQVRTQLAGSIQGIVCQQLVKTSDGQGRVLAAEVLVATPAIRSMIRDGKTHQIYSAMQSGGKFGMLTMDQTLAELVKNRKIAYEDALEVCHHAEDFNRLCGR